MPRGVNIGTGSNDTYEMSARYSYEDDPNNEYRDNSRNSPSRGRDAGSRSQRSQRSSRSARSRSSQRSGGGRSLGGRSTKSNKSSTSHKSAKNMMEEYPINFEEDYIDEESYTPEGFCSKSCCCCSRKKFFATLFLSLVAIGGIGYLLWYMEQMGWLGKIPFPTFGQGQRAALIKDSIMGVSKRVLLEDPTTSQGKAMDWVLYMDKMQVAADSPELIERYIMALVYFATNGIRWSDKDAWLSEWSICTWKGISCSNAKTGKVVTKILLAKNELRGEIPEEISELKFLQEVMLSENKLRGPIPQSLNNLKYLQVLLLEDNALEGELPGSLFSAPALEALYVHWNFLTGTIPDEMSQDSPIRSLSLSRNKFRGYLPRTLGNLRNLEELWVWDAGISGTIPHGLYDLPSLRKLDFGSNALVGTISTKIGNLKKLTELNFDDNLLTGTIPEEVGKLENLEKILLSQNNFKGEISNKICELRGINLRDFVTDCGKSASGTTEVTCNCCTECAGN
eukprot:CAMPEP_0194333782 /NCGR_PEP_ID=MMETSP0171-20130528/63943_1 /TAXON_ID=218684 /ORGANISM="Corethron pennatum, Strain L29A3" /LENGTH=508 /DNA_ID=CAMNT_0039096159 /DNA_START=129 /DNA_END=1655 /DNA_ORIENTATION=-